MKKKVVVVVMFLLVFALAMSGCGGGNKGADTPAPAPAPAPVAQEPAAPEPDEPTGSSSNAEWRQFLKDYEAWVDDYVALMKKYNDDPENLELMNESLALAMDALEWANRADELEDDIPLEELSEYLETISRIIQKLTAVL